MPQDTLFPAEPADTRIQILAATYETLLETGYADLTIERIGDHFPKSTSLVYHHYEGKDELLLDFLSYLIETVEADVAIDRDADARTQLEELLDRVLGTTDDETAAFHRAIVEMRAQATTDPDYRRQFADHDQFFRDTIAAIVDRGIEEGTFCDVDPAAVATTLQALITGTLVQRTTGDVDPSAVRTEVAAYVEGRLLCEERRS